MAARSRSESTVGEVYSPRAVSLRTAVPDYARRDSARGKGLWARRAYGLNQNWFLPCTFKSLLETGQDGFCHLLVIRVRLWRWVCQYALHHATSRLRLTCCRTTSACSAHSVSRAWSWREPITVLTPGTFSIAFAFASERTRAVTSKVEAFG